MGNSKSPAIRVAVDKGKTYYWCRCGLSKSQPFCDGSHKNDEQNRKPLSYTALSDKFIAFCTCKTHSCHQFVMEATASLREVIPSLRAH